MQYIKQNVNFTKCINNNNIYLVAIIYYYLHVFIKYMYILYTYLVLRNIVFQWIIQFDFTSM